MIVLDTTVLVYAKGAEHALREPCRRLLSAVAEGEIVATTSVEAIQEFAHVRARRRGREDAAALGRDYAELLTPLMTITAANLKGGLSLFEQLAGMGAFDAVLAAAARDEGASALVSADSAFRQVRGLAHVLPDAAGIDALLAQQ